MSKLEVYNIWQEQIIVPSEICLGSRKKKNHRSHTMLLQDGWGGINKKQKANIYKERFSEILIDDKKNNLMLTKLS